MNLSNISEGMIVKNYKEFCELVGEQVKGGKSKQLQIKEWERFLSYYKDGQKFIITEILNEPIEKVDNRKGGNHTIYGDYIKNLVMDLLVHNAEQDNERELSFSTNTFLRVLEMINDNYANCRMNIPDFSNVLNIEEDHLYEFFETTHSNLKNALETALNQLQNELLIMWHKELMVCFEHKAKNLIVSSHRIATAEDKEIIMECKAEVLNKFGYSTIDDEYKLIITRQWNTYMKKLNELLYKKKKIYYCYNAYKLVIHRKKVQREYDEIIKHWKMTKFTRLTTKIELNKLLVNRFSTNISKRHEKAFLSDDDAPKQKIRKSDDYIDTQEVLVNTLINRNSPKVKNVK